MKHKIILTLLTCFMPFALTAQTGELNSDLATGYVYVKQLDGKWWFIDPEGEKLVSLGVIPFSEANVVTLKIYNGEDSKFHRYEDAWVLLEK